MFQIFHPSRMIFHRFHVQGISRRVAEKARSVISCRVIMRSLYLRATGVWPAKPAIYTTALANTSRASSVISSDKAANPQWRKLPCLPIATASYVLAETPPEIISASGESSKPPGRDTMPTRSSASTYTLLSAPATSVKNRELWYRRYKAASASVSSPSDGRSREANNRFFHTGSGGLNYPFP